MAETSLFRGPLTEQYRPQAWADVVGQDKVVQRIQALAKRGFAGRAYWLSGQSERLRRALDMLEDNEFRPGPAFQAEGMLRWLRKIRPKGAPEPAMEGLISPDRFAADLDKVFRMRVEWWGG